MTLPRPGQTKYEILSAIVDFCQENAFGPTMEELRAVTDLASRSTVHYHLGHLIEAGLIENDPGHHRGIFPTKRGKSLVKLYSELYA